MEEIKFFSPHIIFVDVCVAVRKVVVPFVVSKCKVYRLFSVIVSRCRLPIY